TPPRAVASDSPAATPDVGPGNPAASSDAAPVRVAARYAFPVRGRTSYSRVHHDYPAADVFARCGTEVVAPTGGVVLEVMRRDRFDPDVDNPALRGGRSWSLAGDDGVRYYGSHLAAVSDRVVRGRRLRAGAHIGQVGQSGNARGSGCHLHFGLSPVCRGRGDWWVRRGTVSPYPFLRAWERGRDRSPEDAVRRWRGRHGCPDRPRGA
ncbi:MAG: M23 family metallopeptidase, partial [Nocardioidaceae bacterium]